MILSSRHSGPGRTRPNCMVASFMQLQRHERGIHAVGLPGTLLRREARKTGVMRFGTFIARNTSVFTTFDNCIARAGNRSAVSDCIARFANDVRP